MKSSIKKVSKGVGAFPSVKSVAIQTRPTYKDASTQTIRETEVIYNTYGNQTIVDTDHTYCTPNSPMDDHHITQNKDMEEEEEFSDSTSTCSSSSNNNYIPPIISPADEESDSEVDSEPNTTDPVKERKFIIFESCLNELLFRCTECNSPALETARFVQGSMIGVAMTCPKNHHTSWRSQPVTNRYPLGNILICAAVMFAGATYTRFHQMCKFISLQVPSPSSFFRIQRNYLFSVIHKQWAREKEAFQKDLHLAKELTLIGDGRCDSPGYSAKYGTYTLMEATTSKIIDFEVVQVTEVQINQYIDLHVCVNDLLFISYIFIHVYIYKTCIKLTWQIGMSFIFCL